MAVMLVKSVLVVRLQMAAMLAETQERCEPHVRYILMGKQKTAVIVLRRVGGEDGRLCRDAHGCIGILVLLCFGYLPWHVGVRLRTCADLLQSGELRYRRIIHEPYRPDLVDCLCLATPTSAQRSPQHLSHGTDGVSTIVPYCTKNPRRQNDMLCKHPNKWCRRREQLCLGMVHTTEGGETKTKKTAVCMLLLLVVHNLRT